MTARSKFLVCAPLLAGITGSNIAGGMDVCVSCECCVLSGINLCVGPITRAEESVVCLSVIMDPR